jgi:PAS domain S-box-containing protein
MSPSPLVRVLYVDDEVALLELARIFLEQRGGMVVDTTPDPREALRMIMSDRYDVIVSDYQMPEMDGITLLKRVREARSQVPFIIFTGRGREEVVIEALNSGADFYLQKGGDPKSQFAELANAIRQLAGRQRAEAAVRKTEEMLHKAERLAHLGSWEFDHRTGDLVWSDETYRIFGRDPKEGVPTYEEFLSIVHPDDRARVDATYSASITDGNGGYEIEHRFFRADTGEVRHVVERCEHLLDESGRVIRSVGMVHDVTEAKEVEERLRESEERVRAKLESILSPEGDIGNLELADIIDIPMILSLLNDFHALTGISVSIIDTHGRVLINAGWQEICTKFHRVHPGTLRNCIESDTQLSTGIAAGEAKIYRCRNNLWQVASPIIVGGKHLGNVFMAQFFLDDEEPDYEVFRTQARHYGFDEEAYIAALDAVPRLSRKTVDSAISFLREAAIFISRLSYANITLARSLTERDALIREREETANRLKRAQEIAHLGSWVFDHTTGQLTWSEETARIFGSACGESSAGYQDYIDYIHPDDRAAVISVHSRSLRDGSDGYEIEHRIIQDGSGEVRYVIERGEHQRDESGRVIRTIGMVHDITERKLAELEVMRRHEELQAAYEQLTAIEEELRSSFEDLREREQQLRESERRLADIIEFLPDAAFVIDVEGRVITWNRAMEKLTGVPKAEMLGRGDYAYAVPFYGEARPILIDYILEPDKALENHYDILGREGDVFESETSLAHPAGREAVLRLRASPLYDLEGRRVGAIETIREVTEQRRVEKELRETAEKMAGIFRVAPIGIAMTVNAIFTEVNDRLCEILGYSRDELIGQHVRLLFPHEEEYETAMQKAFTGVNKSGRFTLETRSQRGGRNDDPVFLQVSGTPLDAGDISRGMALTVQDITESKWMEQEIEYHARELAHQRNSLATANRKLTLMNSITRHDILNQLTVLLGNLSFAQMAGPGEDISNYLDRVQYAADLIRRQIEFTRDYTDLGVRAPEWQRVSDAIRSATLHGLPVEDETGDLMIYADPMLATVFSNLMDNSIRHGESATHVRVWSYPEENGDLVLVWEDDGIGIPLDEKERIFERNFGKNTGLGLFLIREILGITGITITETGEPGKGARFEMRVPHGMHRHAESD